MESPEVFNFIAPDYSFTIDKFKGKLSINHSTINNLHYNYMVSIITSNPTALDQVLHNSRDKSIFYKVYGFSLVDLVNLEFLSSFTQNGRLSLLSINTRIDCDNCIGITPNSKLHLNLNKESYQCLGLDGSSSHFTKKLENRYTATVDLSDGKLLTNKKKFERLRSCLQVLEKVTVLVSWEPPDEIICPSSIAKFFVDLGYRVEECTATNYSHTINTKVFGINLESEDEFDTLEFMEWLGMVMLGCNLKPDKTNYLSSYIADIEDKMEQQVSCLQLKGFFSSNDVKQIIENTVNASTCLEDQWTAIYVQGFSDCPVAWGEEEHHYFTNGDNGYVLVFDKNGGLVYTHKCSRKRYK
ncbi:unnamed protein product [Diabrotica balteata]|uniref:Uncharacterized protein n=1 Tax=Diabrotica balteata TaxID=107213 RepID=A0A9N9T6F2_DIABA|nr:unnamed protein product [Diabrotica balteata]